MFSEFSLISTQFDARESSCSNGGNEAFQSSQTIAVQCIYTYTHIRIYKTLYKVLLFLPV